MRALSSHVESDDRPAARVAESAGTSYVGEGLPSLVRFVLAMALALDANKPGAPGQQPAACKYLYWKLEAWLGLARALAHADRTEGECREWGMRATLGRAQVTMN